MFAGSSFTWLVCQEQQSARVERVRKYMRCVLIHMTERCGGVSCRPRSRGSEVSKLSGAGHDVRLFPRRALLHRHQWWYWLERPFLGASSVSLCPCNLVSLFCRVFNNSPIRQRLWWPERFVQYVGGVKTVKSERVKRTEESRVPVLGEVFFEYWVESTHRRHCAFVRRHCKARAAGRRTPAITSTATLQRHADSSPRQLVLRPEFLVFWGAVPMFFLQYFNSASGLLTLC